MKNNNQQSQRKYYVAEPFEYPLVQKPDFSQTSKQKAEAKDVKKLFVLQMLNKFGNGWRNLKITKPRKLATV